MTSPWNGNTKTILQIGAAVLLSVGSVLGVQSVRGVSSGIPSEEVSSKFEIKLDKQQEALHRMELLLVRIEENTRTK